MRSREKGHSPARSPRRWLESDSRFPDRSSLRLAARTSLGGCDASQRGTTPARDRRMPLSLGLASLQLRIEKMHPTLLTCSAAHLEDQQIQKLLLSVCPLA